MITLRNSILIFVFLFCIIGCTREYTDVVMPDDSTSSMVYPDSAAIETSFTMNLLPILTDRCALSGCHVANGPKGLDLRTYESFKAGSEHGPIFIPGNAAESVVVEEIASGKMSVGGPPLSPDQIQLFVDWINHQAPQEGVVQHEHEEDHDEDMDDDHDDDADDHDDADMDDDHDDNDDDHGDDN